MSAPYAGYRIAQWLSTRLRASVAFRTAETLADCQWRWSATDRAAVEANLTIIRGTMTPGDAPLAREVFRNFGRYLVEFFSLHHTHAPQVQVEGYEHLVNARRRHAGAIILTGHLGNWEVGATLIHRMGFPVTAIALPHRDRRMNRLFNQQRQRCGVDVIPLGAADSVRRALLRLRDGHLLGILGDREFGGHGVMVPLFNRTFVLPRGPATLSLRSRAPVVPSFLIREGIWKFRLYFEPAVWPDARSNPARAIRTLTHTYAQVLERYLARFPEQWLMFQPVAGVT